MRPFHTWNYSTHPRSTKRHLCPYRAPLQTEHPLEGKEGGRGEGHPPDSASLSSRSKQTLAIASEQMFDEQLFDAHAFDEQTCASHYKHPYTQAQAPPNERHTKPRLCAPKLRGRPQQARTGTERTAQRRTGTRRGGAAGHPNERARKVATLCTETTRLPCVVPKLRDRV